MKSLTFSLVSCALVLFSCKQKTSTDAVAKIGNSELSKSTLLQYMPQGIKGKDSIEWCNQWIENWALEQLLIENVEDLEEPSNLEEKVNIYRNQLLIQALKEKIISEQFDPNSVQVKSAENDTTSAIGGKERAIEMKKMEIWQNYQNQLIKLAIETGKWKK